MITCLIIAQTSPKSHSQTAIRNINANVVVPSSSSAPVLPSSDGNVSAEAKETKRFPDAILIGNRKAGARALIDFLRCLNPLVKKTTNGRSSLL